MNYYFKSFINSIFAGFLIFISSLLYLKCLENNLQWLGAILFSIGLLAILEFQFNLFTGRIGYIRKLKEIPELLLILLGNSIGCLPALLFDFSHEIVTNKLQIPWYQIFILSIICGIFIYIAVETFKRNMKWVTLLAIPAFILCGGEHCIADICFIFLTKTFTIDLLWFIPLITIGNSIGALIINFWICEKSKT